MFNMMDPDEKKRMWVVDRHISVTVVGAFVVNAFAAALWIGWWGSSYSQQLTLLSAAVSELKLEQRQMQVNLASTSALADKRLAILEASIPEMKDNQREMIADLRRLNVSLSEYIKMNGK